RPLDARELGMGVGDAGVVQRRSESQAVDRASRFDPHQIAAVRLAPISPSGQHRQLTEERAQNGAGIEVDDHRWSRLSRSKATTSTLRRSFTGLRRFRAIGGACGGTTSASSSSPYGTSQATGIVRSHTTNRSPLRTSARYPLSPAFSSAIPTFFM